MRTPTVALLLGLLPGIAFADADCSKLLDLGKVASICGHAFKLEEGARQVPRGPRSCELKYVSSTIPGVFAPELRLERQYRVYKGKNKARRMFENSTESVRKRGWYEGTVEGVGEAARYEKWNIHERLVWVAGDSTFGIRVTQGKERPESNYFNPCPKARLIQLAREITP